MSADGYDVFHTGARSPLVQRLYQEAFADQWVPGVQATSSCSWWLLGTLVAELRLPPGSLLADLGCGRGGPGIWLARALSTSLIGVDYSPTAIADATTRAPTGTFHVAPFTALPLPDASVDAAISIDAIYFAPDHPAAFAEVHRTLRPGAPFLFTARDTTADWPTVITNAGLTLTTTHTHPGAADRWLRFFALTLTHEPALRAQLSTLAADYMVEEARNAPLRITESTFNLYVTHRPEE
ncbi:class I SAM-dependent methyltransferase [Actinokineospora inagensis]|uniref:class I SAM-dependent methyltransferase n=1 Tax=Actinokineospora inagensis TaxID=103730 RepID=UPI00041772A1|nr:class I SAM-dependent methyltransferase [Actinokineospora inagensis]